MRKWDQIMALHRSVNLGIAASLTLAISLSACGGSVSQPPVSNPPVPTAVRNAAIVAWSRDLVEKKLPQAGCFQIEYPAVTWSRVACSTSREPLAASLESGIIADKGGPSDDGTVKLYASPNLISKAIGSFQDVKVKSVSTTSGKHKGPNSYSLQLNSHSYPSAACGAGAPDCIGWEQFVFSNRGPNGTGAIGIDNWLYHAKKCPKSWAPTPEKKGGFTCQLIVHGVDVPNVPISKLGDVIMTGIASTDGDTLYLAVGTKMYGLRKTQSDGLTDLSKHWQVAEFEVLGDCCSSKAVFGNGTSYTVRLEADTGQSAKPVCQKGNSTTAEWNNLWYQVAPKVASLQYPAIVYAEGNTGSKAWHCYGLPAASR